MKITKRLQEYIPRDTLPKDAENLIVSAMDMRSAALSHMPEGVGERDMPKVLAEALDLYARMGSEYNSSPALEGDAKAGKEDEDMEP